MSSILYLTDKQGITAGYARIFDMLLNGVKIPRNEVIVSSIYNVVPNAIRKKGNMKAWTASPEAFPAVKREFDSKINMALPSVIVTSCPAILAVLTDQDEHANTIEKTRGGVYIYKNIPVIVVYPITASNRITDAKATEEDAEQYNVKSGAWILAQDWRKVSRFFHGKQRKTPVFTFSVVRTRHDVDVAERFLSECSLIACDIETKSGGKDSNKQTFLTCTGYCGLHKSGKVRAFVYPFFDKFSESITFWHRDEDYVYAWESQARINSNSAIKLFQNGTYDNSYFIRDRIPSTGWLLDTIHMWHSLYPELKKSLDFISSILLDNYQYWKADIKGIDEKDETKADKSMARYWRYNALDTFYTLFNGLYMLPTFLSSDWARTNYTSEFMLAISALRMSLRGIRADKKRLSEHEMELLQEGDSAVQRLRYLLDEPQFNANSPAQVNWMLYELLGARRRDAKGNVIGPSSRKKPSSGDSARKLIKTEHPFFKVFVTALEDSKKPFKQISNICRMGQNLQTNRFRYALSAAGTETWRLSGKSSNFWDGTNPQNITKKMRDWLVADDHFIMYDIDFSQSDLYFVAYESQDQKMIDLTLTDLDTHAVHAAHFFKREYDWVVQGKRDEDPEVVDPVTGIRNLSKRVVHGSNFLMAARTLFATMGREAVVAAALALGHEKAAGWTDEALTQVCAALLKSYRNLYPRLSDKEWYGEINELLASKGAITNWYGMTRRFMGDPAAHRTQREATAFYGQSGTAMNMNRVLYELDFGYIPKKFRDGPNPCAGVKPILISDLPGNFMLLQVHDSFVGIQDTRFDCWQDNINKILTVMQRPIMIHGREFHVPAEAEVMTRWSKNAIPWNPQKLPSYDEIRAA